MRARQGRRKLAAGDQFDAHQRQAVGGCHIGQPLGDGLGSGLVAHELGAAGSPCLWTVGATELLFFVDHVPRRTVGIVECPADHRQDDAASRATASTHMVDGVPLTLGTSALLGTAVDRCSVTPLECNDAGLWRAPKADHPTPAPLRFRCIWGCQPVDVTAACRAPRRGREEGCGRSRRSRPGRPGMNG